MARPRPAAARGLARLPDALRAVQAPAAAPGDGPRARLAYDELLADRSRSRWSRGADAAAARPRLIRATARLRAPGAGALRPRARPPAQAQALAEIDADLAAPRRMLRLLQGDVGSGKTLVALLAMLRAVEAGRAGRADGADRGAGQAAPPHAVAALSPVPVALLTGSVKGAQRGHGAARASPDGAIQLVVGTHALFQEAVEYRDLALAVIDEQHRFGVDQRLLLGDKGERTDVLVMTATPIPRTLLLTQWGEMEVSRLTGKPGRAPADPHHAALAGDAAGRARRHRPRKLDAAAQVYWVCPLVAESEAARHRRRRGALRRCCARASAARSGSRTASRTRRCATRRWPTSPPAAPRLLVATTVVEVGVDVPEATRDGDRARRTLRPGAVAPVARPGRPWRGSRASACCCTTTG